MPLGGALIASAAIGAGSSFLGARSQAKAAQRAAEQQEKLAREGIGTMRERTLNANNVLNNSMGILEPYQTTGYNAGQAIANGTMAGNSELNRAFTLQDFQASPGYEFARNEGQRGIQSSAAARGGVLGGGTLKAISRFNEGLASGEFNNERKYFTDNQNQKFNQLYSLFGLGANAAGQQAGIQGNIAGNIYNEGVNELTGLTGIGNVQGAATAAGGAAYGGAYQNAGNQIGQAITLQQILKAQKQNGYSNSFSANSGN